VQVVTAVFLLYQILGWSSVAGIGVMILLLPINYVISSQFSKIQQRIMSTTDKRIHTTNEVLQNIRIIKFFAWEQRFAQVVNESRTAELKQLRERYILWAVAATSWYGSPLLITLLSFFCYTVIEKKTLDAPIAFTALSLFNVLRVPLDQLADMVTNVLQTKVSIDRVEEFLSEEETEKYHQLKQPDEVDPNAPLIGFGGASFTWGTKQQIAKKGMGSAFQLQDLNVEFVPGYLNVIAGPTGSGKTSLLMALLGEMTLLKGR
jgi:ABC-type multidrug transport system fused ATPase/permease subunit